MLTENLQEKARFEALLTELEWACNETDIEELWEAVLALRRFCNKESPLSTAEKRIKAIEASHGAQGFSCPICGTKYHLFRYAETCCPKNKLR